jgi:hypothetical protein
MPDTSLTNTWRAMGILETGAASQSRTKGSARLSDW